MKTLHIWSLILLLGLNTQCSQPAKKEKDSVEFDLNQLKLQEIDGNPIDLKNYRGKTLIINLWATWCKPCIAEMPSLVRLQKALPEKEYVILLASDEPGERISSFIASSGFDLHFVQSKSSMESLGIYAIPSTLIINGEGRLVEIEVGAKEWDSEESILKIKNLSAS